MNDSDHCLGKNGNINEINLAIATENTISTEAMMLMNENIFENISETKKVQ